MAGIGAIFISSASPNWEQVHKRFFRAIEKSDGPVIERTVREYPDAVSWTGPKGRAPLTVALEANQLNAFNLLLALGADKHTRVACPISPQKKAHILFYAVLLEKMPFVESLLKAGASVSAMNHWEGKNWHTTDYSGNDALTAATWLAQNGHLKKPQVIDLLKRADILRAENDKSLSPVATAPSAPAVVTVPKNAVHELAPVVRQLQEEVRRLTARVEELENPGRIDLGKAKMQRQNSL